MTNVQKGILWCWTILVLFGVVFGVYLSEIPKTHSGEEVRFSISSGWVMEVSSESPVSIQAADNDYFRLAKDDIHLYGVPGTPPLDYTYDEYFYLEDQLSQGEWDIHEGTNVSVKLASENPVRVTLRPTSSHVFGLILVSCLVGLVIWLIGLLLLLNTISAD